MLKIIFFKIKKYYFNMYKKTHFKKLLLPYHSPIYFLGIFCIAV